MSSEVLTFPERRLKPLAHPRVRRPLPRRDMQRWYCDGWNERKDQQCRTLLMEVGMRKGRIRVKCPNCNSWNVMVAL